MTWVSLGEHSECGRCFLVGGHGCLRVQCVASLSGPQRGETPHVRGEGVAEGYSCRGVSMILVRVIFSVMGKRGVEELVGMSEQYIR